MVDSYGPLTIFHGVYKPTYKRRAAPCITQLPGNGKSPRNGGFHKWVVPEKLLLIMEIL